MYLLQEVDFVLNNFFSENVACFFVFVSIYEFVYIHVIRARYISGSH